MSKVSIVVPFHWMENWQYFLTRCLKSIEDQSFKDYEVILTKAGSMPVNSNKAIQSAEGEIIKILYMDDYFGHPEALQNVVDAVGNTWAVSGCIHTEDGNELEAPHYPFYNPQIYLGNNTIGSPSVLAFKNDDSLLFDERLSWLLDCDLYKRLYERYGEPHIINSLDIVIGIGSHQTSVTMPEEEKQKEYEYVKTKHETWISA